MKKIIYLLLLCPLFLSAQLGDFFPPYKEKSQIKLQEEFASSTIVNLQDTFSKVIIYQGTHIDTIFHWPTTISCKNGNVKISCIPLIEDSIPYRYFLSDITFTNWFHIGSNFTFVDEKTVVNVFPSRVVLNTNDYTIILFKD